MYQCHSKLFCTIRQFLTIFHNVIVAVKKKGCLIELYYFAIEPNMELVELEFNDMPFKSMMRLCKLLNFGIEKYFKQQSLKLAQ